MNSEIEEDCKDFLSNNKVSFEQLIRCYNYWSELDGNETNELIKLYEDGAFRGGGWY